MAKNDFLEIEGKVLEIIPGGKFKVELENGHIVEAHVSGKRKGKIMVICENPKHKQKQG